MRLEQKHFQTNKVSKNLPPSPLPQEAAGRRLPPEEGDRQQGQEKATDPACWHKSGLDKSLFIQRLKKRSQNLRMYGRGKKKKESHKEAQCQCKD